MENQLSIQELVELEKNTKIKVLKRIYLGKRQFKDEYVDCIFQRYQHGFIRDYIVVEIDNVETNIYLNEIISAQKS